MKKTLVTLCLSFMIGAASNAFSKDITEAECVNLFRNTFNSNSKLLNATVDRLSVNAEKKSLLMGIYVWYGNNQKMLERLAHDLNQVGMLKDGFANMKDRKERNRLIQQASLNFIMSYYRNGLLKAGPEELRRYVRFETLKTKALPDRLCKKYHYGAKDADFYTKVSELQGYFYRALSVSEVKDYIAHYKNVLSLAINENISARELTHFQSEAGFKAFENALVTRLSQLPDREKQRLTSAIAYPQSSNSLAVCDSVKLMLKALDSLDGDPFIWATTNILTESGK